jgi:hypothetical protein
VNRGGISPKSWGKTRGKRSLGVLPAAGKSTARGRLATLVVVCARSRLLKRVKGTCRLMANSLKMKKIIFG